MLNCLKCFDRTVFWTKTSGHIVLAAKQAQCKAVAAFLLQSVMHFVIRFYIGFKTFERNPKKPNSDFVSIQNFRSTRLSLRDHRRSRFSRPQLLNFKTARSCPAGQSDERPLMVLVRMAMIFFCPKDIISLYHHLANNHTACVSFGVSQANFG